MQRIFQVNMGGIFLSRLWHNISATTSKGGTKHDFITEILAQTYHNIMPHDSNHLHGGLYYICDCSDCQWGHTDS